MIDTYAGVLLTDNSALLGNLDNKNAENELDVARLLDEEDPVRKALQVFPLDKQIDAQILFTNGTKAKLLKVLEIGYGAARLKIQMVRRLAFHGSSSEHFEKEAVAVIRFSAIAMISKEAQ